MVCFALFLSANVSIAKDSSSFILANLVSVHEVARALNYSKALQFLSVPCALEVRFLRLHFQKKTLRKAKFHLLRERAERFPVPAVF